MTPDSVTYWRNVARELAPLKNGARTACVSRAAEMAGISLKSAYRRLKECGWTSGRQKRRDTGKSRQPQKVIEELAAMRREGTRANGKGILTITTGMSVLSQSGRDVNVSRSQVSRLLKAQRLDAKSLGNAESFVRMRSAHPNHVHQVDPSLCVLYYLKGRQHLMREQEFYKNKLEKFAKVQQKVWRYVRTDHASAVIDVKYYQAAGETQANLFDFLCHTWGKKKGRTSHGVPRILVWDKGSANTASGVKNVLRALDVRPIEHAAERANVKGQVEVSNNIVELGFEARLKFEPVESVEQLNAACEKWQEAFNSGLLPRTDSRLRRQGARPAARHDLWALITAEQLREMPPKHILGRLMEGRHEERTVTRQRLITYRHPMAEHSLTYPLAHCEGLQPGDRVQVSPLLLEPGMDIRIRFTNPMGEEITYRAAPVTDTDRFGFPTDAPLWGEEYRAMRKTDAQKNLDRLDAIAFPDHPDAREARRKQITPFRGELNAISHLWDIDTPTYLPREGEEISVTAPEDIRAPVPLNPALLALADAWGRRITREENRWLRAAYPDGIPEEALTVLKERGTEPRPEAPKLRAVG